ncbi:uncharacterized protein ABIA39_004137 [Nocardia sp. GAS34]|uniref:FxsB family cyclophane-forming radical SAM/SPASM peptide maturase n=1 Tax=unclassified Nocardia TaxID=2637762 RepID=UPI003D1ED11A
MSTGKYWPAEGLDVSGLRAGGWAPLPFTEYVIKIHSRCNLACDYCYMYEMVDQSWRDQPKVMDRKVFENACRMIAEHAARFGVREVQLVFHGGEPLLAGYENLDRYARIAREILEPVTAVEFGLQTNGVLLDRKFLEICDRWSIRIGVSVDGDERGHDRHRRDRRGRGSYVQVVAGLEQLLDDRYRHLFSGILCTVDVANDPMATYEALVGFEPPAIDFLLPHGNWQSPPPQRTSDPATTPYADWLIPIFDRWYGAPRLETQVRLFDIIIQLLLGGRDGSESLGLAPIQLAVIETDGSLEQVDELKSAFAGATRLPIGGQGNPLDLALTDPHIVARQIGAAALSEDCLACPVHTVCGGGHYVHRYRPDTGFRNPSVYCADLKKLIEHIESRVRADIVAALVR